MFCGVNVSYTIRQNIQLIRCNGESCMCFLELIYPLTKPPTVFNVDRLKCIWICSLEFCGKYIIWLCNIDILGCLICFTVGVLQFDRHSILQVSPS